MQSFFLVLSQQKEYNDFILKVKKGTRRTNYGLKRAQLLKINGLYTG
jgi:hypothetical protein